MRILQSITFFLVWLNIFTMPWQVSLIIPGVGSINKAVGLLLIPAALLTVLIRKRMKKPLAVFYFMFLFLAWNAITFFWSIDSELAIEKFSLFLQLFFLAWCIFEFTNTKEQINKLLVAYILGNTIVALMTIYQFYTTDTLFSSTRFYMEGYNPNSTGVIMALGIPMAIYLAGIKSKLTLVYIPLSLMAIFIMASRSVTLVLLVISVITIVYLFIQKIKFRKTLTLVLLITTVIVFTFIPEGQKSRILSIDDELSSGTLSDRTIIWENGLRAFSENFAVGVGSGNFINSMRFLYSTVEMNAHNAFLSVAVENGVIGLLMFAAILLILLFYTVNLGQRNKEKWLSIGLLFPWLVMSLSSHNEAQKYTWLIFSFVICFYAINKKEKSKKKMARI